MGPHICIYISFHIIDNTCLRKTSPRVKFHCSDNFFSDEYEYESHFFPHRTDFPKFYDNGLKISKIDWGNAEVNKKIQ